MRADATIRVSGDPPAPSPAEIAAACRAIQARWTEEERAARYVAAHFLRDVAPDIALQWLREWSPPAMATPDSDDR